MDAFNYLPYELYLEIFKNLSLKDLIKIKSLSKRFRYVFDTFQVHKLIICDSRAHNCFKGHLPCSINSTADDFLRFRSQFDFETNLTTLFLNYPNFNRKNFFLNELNLFKQLKHLEVVIQDLSYGFALRLEHCEIFRCEIRNPSLNNHQLTISMPKLKLLSGDLNRLKIIHRNSITNYEYTRFDKTVAFFNRKILNLLPNLKNLSIDLDLGLLTKRRYDSFQNLLIDILKKKSDLIIHIQSVRLDICEDKMAVLNELRTTWTEYDQISEYHFNNFDNLDSRLSAYKKLDYFTFQVCHKRIPSIHSFFEKFSNVQFLVANDLTSDNNDFNRFLTHLKCLRKLHLIGCDLVQQFYNQIPKLIYLEELNIRGSSKEQINLDFVLKFDNLKLFFTSTEIEDGKNSKKMTDQISNYFGNLKALKLFEFKLYDSDFIEIVRLSRTNRFLLSFYSVDRKRYQLYKRNYELSNLEQLENKIIDNLKG